MEMDPGAIRNFKDFLQLYNKMSEICFLRCVDNINSRKLDENEITCVEDCSAKFIKFNNKLMQNFVKAQTEIVNKRVEDAEKQNHLESSATKPEGNQVESTVTQTQNELTYNTLNDRGPDHSQEVISK